MIANIRPKRWLITTVAIILLSCILAQIAVSQAVKPIPSREELCHALTGHIEWSACVAQPSVTQVLIKAFPFGITTREEVHSALGQYLSYATANCFSMQYQLSSNWMIRNLGFQEIEHVFIYDRDGRLVDISVQD